MLMKKGARESFDDELKALCQSWVDLKDENKQMKGQLELLALLSSDGPEFCNPLVALRAKSIRDKILKGIKK